jgi:hypothetical protein
MTRQAYEEAIAVCCKLALSRLNAIQREYQREILAIVEAYEDTNGETERALADLKELAVLSDNG